MPLTVVEHPLVAHKLALLRDRRTTTKEFRHLVAELAALLTYEATRDLGTEPIEVETPLARTTQRKVSGKKLAVVPVFRAGLGMLDAVLDLIPVARVGFVGLYRDEETLEPVEYYAKFPADLEQRRVLLIDPMLATGGSTSAACGLLKEGGAGRITVICLVAAPEGVERVAADHRDVHVVAAALDRQLNEDGYIVPGLGDAGDRLYGTR
ncbi:MAG: uracil phosphoribosyltransferase [Acidimicrobiia bacterium]